MSKLIERRLRKLEAPRGQVFESVTFSIVDRVNGEIEVIEIHTLRRNADGTWSDKWDIEQIREPDPGIREEPKPQGVTVAPPAGPVEPVAPAEQMAEPANSAPAETPKISEEGKRRTAYLAAVDRYFSLGGKHNK